MLTFSVVVEEERDGPPRSKEELTFCSVACWEDLADRLEQNLRKGTAVYVEGKIMLRKWVDSEDRARSGLSCSAWAVQPMARLGRKLLNEATAALLDHELDIELSQIELPF